MVADKTCPVGDRVCVIGAGVLGLVAIKNFKEQGLRVTAFERHERLGGSWDLSQKTDQVTALQMTTANVSKQTVKAAESCESSEQADTGNRCVSLISHLRKVIIL